MPGTYISFLRSLRSRFTLYSSRAAQTGNSLQTRLLKQLITWQRVTLTKSPLFFTIAHNRFPLDGVRSADILLNVYKTITQRARDIHRAGLDDRVNGLETLQSNLD